jgi:hypothetical protein
MLAPELGRPPSLLSTGTEIKAIRLDDLRPRGNRLRPNRLDRSQRAADACRRQRPFPQFRFTSLFNRPDIKLILKSKPGIEQTEKISAGVT